jgi:hypothetical protein
MERNRPDTGGGRTRLPCLAFLLLAACSAPPPPTDTPVTATARPAESQEPGLPVASPTRGPLTDPTPGAVLEAPEPTATPTLAPAPVNLPPERLAIFEPGPGSQVTSPFVVSGRGGPSFNGRVHLRLYGEDGRLLAQRTTYLHAIPAGTGRFVTELTFELPGVAEAARLEVSTDDLRTGRMAHLTTLDLVLLTAGTPHLTTALHGPEHLLILTPRDGALVAGGQVLVRGAGWSDLGEPLTLTLLDRQGNTLASRLVQLSSSLPGQIGVFETHLAYEIPYEQYGRIAVFEALPDGSGFRHYASIEVYLRR